MCRTRTRAGCRLQAAGCSCIGIPDESGNSTRRECGNCGCGDGRCRRRKRSGRVGSTAAPGQSTPVQGKCRLSQRWLAWWLSVLHASDWRSGDETTVLYIVGALFSGRTPVSCPFDVGSITETRWDPGYSLGASLSGCHSAERHK